MSTQRSMAKGAAWMIVVRVCDRSIGFVSLLILARLLTPSDFGVVALASSVLEVIYLLGAFSLDVALIQNQEATKEHYDTVWTLNFSSFCLYALLLVAAAGPASHFYHDDRLVHVMQVLAIGLVVRGFENIYLVDFRKDLRFDKEFIVFLVKRLSGFAITTGLAIAFRDYWALVFGTLASYVISTAFSYKVVSRRPTFTLVAARELFHFSKWMFINNSLSTLLGRAPDFFIGRIAGAASLGVFNLAREISAMPTSELIAPINRAALPAFSRLAKDLPALRDTYLKTLGLALLAAIPAATGIAVLAPLFVDVALGAHWVDASPLIRLIAIGGVLSIAGGPAGYVFIALGKPRLNTWIFALQPPIMIPGLYWLGHAYGLLGAACAVTIAPVLVVPVTLYLVARELRFGPAALVATMWRPFTASVAMAIALQPVLSATSGSRVAELAGLFAIPVVGAFVFVAVLALIARVTGRWSTAEQIVLAELRLRWTRLAARRSASVDRSRNDIPPTTPLAASEPLR